MGARGIATGPWCGAPYDMSDFSFDTLINAVIAGASNFRRLVSLHIHSVEVTQAIQYNRSAQHLTNAPAVVARRTDRGPP